jgi:hypothetical protein
MIMTVDLVTKELAEMGNLTTETLDMLAPKIRDVFALLERGAIDSSQAALILRDSVHFIIPVVDQLSEQAKETFRNMINDAVATGIEFDGLSELASLLGTDLEALQGSAQAGMRGATSAVDSLQSSLSSAAREALHLKRQLESLDDVPVKSAGGGGDSISAQHGLPPTYFPRGGTITVHPGEVGSVIPANRVGSGGGGGGGPLVGEVHVHGTVFGSADEVRRAVEKAMTNIYEFNRGNVAGRIQDSQDRRAR